MKILHNNCNNNYILIVKLMGDAQTPIRKQSYQQIIILSAISWMSSKLSLVHGYYLQITVFIRSINFWYCYSPNQIIVVDQQMLRGKPTSTDTEKEHLILSLSLWYTSNIYLHVRHISTTYWTNWVPIGTHWLPHQEWQIGSRDHIYINSHYPYNF